MTEEIKFTRGGIETMEIVSNPLTRPERRKTTIPYDKITQLNPLDLHVIGIRPIIREGVIAEIALEIGGEDSSYHTLEWFADNILSILSDGSTLKKDEIYQRASSEFNSSDFKKLRGGMTRAYSNLTSALNYLKGAGKIENPRKGYWRKIE
jgi:hypothetical protein